MRHRTVFDEGVFLASFSVALGVLALIIPAHGSPSSDIEADQAPEYIDLCDTGSARPDCAPSPNFTGEALVGSHEHSSKEPLGPPIH